MAAAQPKLRSIRMEVMLLEEDYKAHAAFIEIPAHASGESIVAALQHAVPLVLENAFSARRDTHVAEEAKKQAEQQKEEQPAGKPPAPALN